MTGVKAANGVRAFSCSINEGIDDAAQTVDEGIDGVTRESPNIVDRIESDQFAGTGMLVNFLPTFGYRRSRDPQICLA